MTADVLTARQRAFVEAYLGRAHFNATAAAKLAGYSDKTAYSIGSENLKKPDIACAIRERLAEAAMGADEVLAQIADIARGSMSDFLDVRTGYQAVDLNRAAESGKLHLLSEYEHSRKSGVRIKLHDKLGALDKLARVYGLYKEQQQSAEALDLLRYTLRVGKSAAEMEAAIGDSA